MILYKVHNVSYTYCEYVKALNPKYAHNIAKKQCRNASKLTVVPIKRVSKGEYHVTNR